jgi:hypothetical protein
MIDAERQCCQFLRFQLTVEAAGRIVVLDVNCSADSEEFLSGDPRAGVMPVSSRLRRPQFFVGVGTPCASSGTPLDSEPKVMT